MAKKANKKVRRVEIEKVKNGEGGHLHKVTAHFHSTPGSEGKGMKGLSSTYHDPEETYHTSHAKAKKKVHEHMQSMTATPEEEPVMETQGGVSARPGAALNDADDVGVAG